MFSSKVDLHLKLREAWNEFLKSLNVHLKIKSLSKSKFILSGYHRDK